MSQAWHAGVIAKSNKTPPLSQLFGEKAKPQTPAQMEAALKVWVGATRHLGPATLQ